MANKVTIDVEARFVDNITDESKSASKAVEGIGKEAEKAQKKVDNLGKKKASPIFDADDNKFLKKIRSMEEKMKKMGHTKTAAVLELVDKATNGIGKVANSLQRLVHKSWDVALKYKDSNTLGYIRNVTNGLENITKKTWQTMVKVKDAALAPIKAIKNALFSIPTLITTIIGAKVVKTAWNQGILNPINLADQYTGAYIGFKTLLGESEAQAMMDEIDLFAKKTPFKTSGVISNVQKMMAYGWDVDRVIDDMETIGDAAAATGKGDAGLESIVRALAEIRSKGKLSTQELNQLAGAGIKAKAYLAEGLGYGSSDEGMMKLAEDLEGGAIGANQAIDLILQGMKEFDGMMDATANEKVEGLISQLADAFEINIARRWGQGLQDGAKRGLGTVVSLLDDADESLAALGDTLYELGQTAANWVADKLEIVVNKIKEITDSYEFKNASIGDKVSMLWNGVVADPVKEWWEGGARDKVIETATDVGKAIGKAILDGLVMTWNSLPWWGKLLVGGYAAGKTVSGIGNVIQGVQSLGGTLSGASNLVSAGAANIGYWALGGKTAATMAGVSGTTAALTGTGVVAGGLATLAGMYHVADTGTQAYQDFKSGDKRSGWANVARAGGTAAGMLTGAAIGAKWGAGIGTVFGGPIGTAAGGIIGAGLGTLVGWFAGDTIAKNIEAAKYEAEGLKEAIKDGADDAKIAEEYEKALWENAKNHFGDIKLSIDEIQRLANQIVWGDDLQYFEKFTAATKNAESSLQSMKKASEDIDKWMWKSGLGVKFNDDEKEAFVASVNDYINASQSYLENKHYEFTASAELLLDLESDEGKSILESGNAFYAKEQEALTAAGKELGDTLVKALEDGIISADENAAVIAAQQKIASITEKINNAEATAEIELIKVKWGEGNLDYESFEKFMSTMETTLNERMSGADDAFTIQVSNLKLRYPEGGEQYEKELATLISGYKAEVEKIRADILGVELNIIGDAYAQELGADAASDLRNALQNAINNNIEPINITDEQLSKWLKVDESVIEGETGDNIRDMLQGVFNQLDLVEVDGDILVKIGTVQVGEGTAEKVKKEIDKAVPDKAEKTVDVNVTGTPILNPFTLNPGNLVNMTGFTYRPTINIQPRLGSVGTVNADGSGYRGGIFGGSSAMEAFARGGRPGDGMLKGSTRFIRVNEEYPEMIIPLSSQRRARAKKLWTKTGSLLGVPGFARGGMTAGGQDEGIRFNSYGSNDSVSGQSVQVDIGGLTFEINVNGNDSQSITAAIKEQAEEIAEVVAGVLADALGAQFENTPARGGVA